MLITYLWPLPESCLFLKEPAEVKMAPVPPSEFWRCSEFRFRSFSACSGGRMKSVLEAVLLWPPLLGGMVFSSLGGTSWSPNVICPWENTLKNLLIHIFFEFFVKLIHFTRFWPMTFSHFVAYFYMFSCHKLDWN